MITSVCLSTKYLQNFSMDFNKILRKVSHCQGLVCLCLKALSLVGLGFLETIPRHSYAS